MPANTLDGSLATRWSAKGDGQWIRFDLGSSRTIGSVAIAWHKGNQRQALFEIQTSTSGSSWTKVSGGASSGTTLEHEDYNVSDSVARYVRIVGRGNSDNMWNSITEVEIYGPTEDGTDNPTTPSLPAVTVVATDANASETGPDPGTFTLSRTGNTTSALTVSYSLGGGAANGTDYEGLSGSVTIPAGAASASVNVRPIDDNAVEGNETLVLTVSQHAAYVVGSPGSATVSIADNDQAPPTTTLPTIAKTSAYLQIGNGKVPYYRNRPLGAYDPRVTRAIIVVHGSGGNASGYFDRVNNVIPSTWKDKVFVIAPHFQEEGEAGSGEFWWDGDWREGGDSGGISSYTVVDTMVAQLRSSNFPNLKWVIITGHSAGGQFSQRYAAFTDIDLLPAPNGNGAFVKFVPANPSSYVYLNEFRLDDNNWVVPQQDCSGEGYNEYKFGLDRLYDYAARRGADYARNHLPLCKVELLAGEEDVVADSGFDDSCPAMWQGPTRYARAHIFDAFMDKFYGGNHFSVTSVPGVGHDGTKMFASTEGKNALFFAD
jgi:pimeloyl-ACP methyl ester carboxylesterase